MKIDVVDVVRSVGCFVVILAHTHVLHDFTFSEPRDWSILFFVINVTGTYLVDTFLFLSGFLLGQKITQLQKQRPDGDTSIASLLSLLVGRMLRLAPALFVVTLLLTLAGVPNCPGIAEFFFLANMTKSWRQLCLPQTWSTQVDFHGWLVVLFVYYVVTLTSFLSESKQKKEQLGATPYWILTLCCLLLRYWYYQYIGFPKLLFILSLQDSITKESLEFMEKMLQVRHGWDIDSPSSIARASAFSAYAPFYFDSTARMATLALGTAVYFSISNRKDYFASFCKALPITKIMLLVATMGVCVAFNRPLLKQQLFGSHVLLDHIWETIHRILFTTVIAVFISHHILNSKEVDRTVVSSSRMDKFWLFFSGISYPLYMTHTLFIGPVNFHLMPFLFAHFRLPLEYLHSDWVVILESVIVLLFSSLMSLAISNFEQQCGYYRRKLLARDVIDTKLL